MLGCFGVQIHTESKKIEERKKKNGAFVDAWQKIIRRLRSVLANWEAPEAVLKEYNAYKGLGIEMNEEYAKTCKGEAHASSHSDVFNKEVVTNV